MLIVLQAHWNLALQEVDSCESHLIPWEMINALSTHWSGENQAWMWCHLNLLQVERCSHGWFGRGSPTTCFSHISCVKKKLCACSIITPQVPTNIVFFFEIGGMELGCDWLLANNRLWMVTWFNIIQIYSSQSWEWDKSQQSHRNHGTWSAWDEPFGACHKFGDLVIRRWSHQLPGCRIRGLAELRSLHVFTWCSWNKSLGNRRGSNGLISCHSRNKCRPDVNRECGLKWQPPTKQAILPTTVCQTLVLPENWGYPPNFDGCIIVISWLYHVLG